MRSNGPGTSKIIFWTVKYTNTAYCKVLGLVAPNRGTAVLLLLVVVVVVVVAAAVLILLVVVVVVVVVAAVLLLLVVVGVV